MRDYETTRRSDLGCGSKKQVEAAWEHLPHSHPVVQIFIGLFVAQIILSTTSCLNMLKPARRINYPKSGKRGILKNCRYTCSSLPAWFVCTVDVLHRLCLSFLVKANVHNC